MGRTSRKKRSTLANRAIIASAALILGGGGLAAVNVYASAGEGSAGSPHGRHWQQPVRQASTIDCPEVVDAIPEVPAPARAEVDRELAAMDTQITDAYREFADRRDRMAREPGLAENTVLGPLRARRTASIDRIATAIGRSAKRPERLGSLAPCSMRADDDPPEPSQDPSQDPSQAPSQDPGNGGDGNGDGRDPAPSGNGPEDSDFVDIQSVQPDAGRPARLRGASRGTFTTECGRNENGKFNPDNVIAAPGVSNGAHHMHDYVGNQATDAFAGDDELAAGDTTCRNQGDRSTYYWPVLRLQNGADENDADADGGGRDQNTGEIQTPAQVTLKFTGNPTGKVTAMPRFLRIITGDAKAFTNGDANANASWSCTGFEDRQLKDKYPICPQGSQVVRSFAFQSCRDGQNTDSANHRTHVAFAQDDGRCPEGFRAIPQLVQRIVYDVPPGPGFAVDSFPEQLHKPVTDHGDFINVFDARLMRKVVSCINSGRTCR
ncbi:DUF1996 domain-containing protein [Streptomyces sp. ITFR-16]|uniref:DUF1996 domain-containing protein n=1 Tax=Streptomyces sp. ITFR-16 TaxID=3075198 RepID=UPI002889F8F0|nr:DUF1996 domain-containing protein [Streptomyces sp. ITFR-16]WNI25133.1 DUF1996 domain-containing protein [Streptomyces sp. ITFR-16]